MAQATGSWSRGRLSAATFILVLLIACCNGQPASRQASVASHDAADPHVTVTVTPSNGGYAVRVAASGLEPGRTYALHLHRGRCVGPGSVESRYDLPSLRADARGHGVITALVKNGPPAGPPTVLHVHGGDAAGTAEYRKVECVALPGP